MTTRLCALAIVSSMIATACAAGPINDSASAIEAAKEYLKGRCSIESPCTFDPQRCTVETRCFWDPRQAENLWRVWVGLTRRNSQQEEAVTYRNGYVVLIFDARNGQFVRREEGEWKEIGNKLNNNAEFKKEDCEPDAPIGKLLTNCATGPEDYRIGPERWFMAIRQCWAKGIYPNPDCGTRDKRELTNTVAWTVASGDLEMFDWLLAHGLKPEPSQVWYALVGCGPKVCDRALRVFDRFLATGIDINAVDERGWTALASVAAAGNVAMTEALLSRGADPNAGGTTCQSTLDYAYYHNVNSKPATILEAHGARPRNPITKALCKANELRSISH